MIDLSIVVVNWHSRDYLRKCLSSIAANTRQLSYEIIVVDSASFDGCGEMLRSEFPFVQFIQSHENLGFAAANNRGVSTALGEYLLFLNPDTELVGGAIDTLWSEARRLPHAGVVGARLLNADQTVQSSCIQAFPTVINQLFDSEFLRSRWPKSRLWGTAALHAEGQEPQVVEGISGACMLVAMNVFERAGRFSEDYFMYAEDMELCEKARRAGYVNYYVPSATVTHFGGGSSAQSRSTFGAVMMPEAIWRFLRKTRGGAYASGYRAAMTISALGRLAILGVARLTLRGGAAESYKSSSRKWFAILKWSLFCEPVVKQYYPTRHTSCAR